MLKARRRHSVFDTVSPVVASPDTPMSASRSRPPRSTRSVDKGTERHVDSGPVVPQLAKLGRPLALAAAASPVLSPVSARPEPVAELHAADSDGGTVQTLEDEVSDGSEVETQPPARPSVWLRCCPWAFKK